jgi:hypothetical protein
MSTRARTALRVRVRRHLGPVPNPEQGLGPPSDNLRPASRHPPPPKISEEKILSRLADLPPADTLGYPRETLEQQHHKASMYLVHEYLEIYSL